MPALLSFFFLFGPRPDKMVFHLVFHFPTQLLGLKTRESNGSGAINLNKENEGSWSNGSETTSCEVNLKTSSNTDSRLYLNNQHHHHQQQRNKHSSSAAAAAAMFPTAIGAANLTQLPVSNECFGNMFGSIEESQEFWPWSDQQQNFHWLKTSRFQRGIEFKKKKKKIITVVFRQACVMQACTQETEFAYNVWKYQDYFYNFFFSFLIILFFLLLIFLGIKRYVH